MYVIEMMVDMVDMDMVDIDMVEMDIVDMDILSLHNFLSGMKECWRRLLCSNQP